MKRLIFSCFFFLFGAATIFAQTSRYIDSLKQLLKSPYDSAVVHNYLMLEMAYRNINIDTAFYYSRKALDFATEKHLDYYMDGIYNSLASDYKLAGNINKAEEFYKKSLSIAIKNNDSSSISSSYNNLGVLYAEFGKYKKALDYHMESLEIAENTKDLYNEGSALNNIGLIYYKLDNYDRALSYYNKALKIKKEQKNLQGIALLYNNIGIIYYYKNETDKVFIYFKKALRIWKQKNDLRQTSLTLGNLGELHMELNQLNKALQYVLRADEINEHLKDKANLIYTKSLIGDIYFKRKRYYNAQTYYNKAIVVAKEIDAKQDLHDLYEKLSKLFEASGDISNSYKYYKLKTELDDSLINRDKQKAIEELQTKYETKKKEQEIELLNNEKKLSAAVQKNQRIIIFSLIGGLLLVLFMVFIIIKRNIERRKANELLARKNDEIAHQKEELTSSIAYAQRIQTAMLPQNQIVDASLSDYFIFFKPKDVVSGDFFWWTHFDKYTVISVADCTGHGVPGAFMSILGVSFLREIVSKERITHPGTILNRLRTEIITALHQKGVQGEQKDGMDMSLITINHETKILQYAGANNPLYLITNEKIKEFVIPNPERSSRIGESQSKKEKFPANARNDDSKSKIFSGDTYGKNLKFFYEIKADKMPIAIYYKMNPFSTTEILLHPSDQIYLFSDGYADQFGGEKGKKFKYQPFKNLLLENAHKSMSEQKEALEQVFDAWKDHYEQIDDVTVVGIKI